MAPPHVDRSIEAASAFIQTNIVGTFNLLDQSKKYFNNLGDVKKQQFIFHHVSTDEVYGDLEGKNKFFLKTHLLLLLHHIRQARRVQII